MLTSILKFALKALVFLLIAVFLVRGWDSLSGPPLSAWHKFVPADATAADIDTMDWPTWMARENALFESVRREVSDKLPPEEQIPLNRYWAKSPVNPDNLSTNWNRSFVLEPADAPVGAVVLLHGLTDGPYSLRHIAQDYQARGYVAVAIRNPGHGTVPAGLTKSTVADWEAATRLAVREAHRRAPGKPLHIVGYSNGAALAITYALAAGTNKALPAPDRLVLLSPMVGLTAFARFAGIAGLPAIIPAFSRAAWLGTVPEYNPYKYNSFPVKAAVESNNLTVKIREKIQAAEADGSIARFPPVLAFQSVVDSTVMTRAVVTGLFAHLPANGSELVLFDINRAAYVGPLLRGSARNALNGLLPAAPRRYTTSIIVNAEPGSEAAVVRMTQAGATREERLPLAIPYRRDIFSLGHIALPFPLTDGLYGLTPDPADQQGAQLGALATRGENGQLGASMEGLMRISSNPFYPLVIEKIAAGQPASTPGSP